MRETQMWNLLGRFPDKDMIKGGAVAGLVGGLTMATFQMGISASNGQPLTTPFHLIAGLFRAILPVAAEQNATAAVVGFLIHMGISAFFGAIFGACLLKQTHVVDAFFGGLVFGAIVWAGVNYVLFLPYSATGLAERMALTPELWFLAHLIFGCTLFLTPLTARLFYRPGERTHEDRAEDRLAA